MYFDLDMIKDKGWHLTTDVQELKCVRCEHAIMEQEFYFCPEEEVFYCKSCGKIGKMSQACSLIDQHEHLHIVELEIIQLGESEVQEKLK